MYNDLRYAIRTLLKNPGFTSVVVLSLALGIGANSTMFSVINAVLLRPLKFREPDRLVALYEFNLEQTRSMRNPALFSFLEWRRNTASFEQMELAVDGPETYTVTGSGEPERIRGQFISPDLFALLGVGPTVGRSFMSEDLGHEASANIVISHGLWERRFGKAHDVVGMKLKTGSRLLTVVGVMPPGFWVFPYTRDTDFWTALSPTDNPLTPNTRWFTILARLKPGTSLKQAQTEMDVFARRTAQDHPETNKGWGLLVEPLSESYSRGWGEILYLLLGAVGFVLLIACANAAHLLLARATKRRREFAIRVSLGAARKRIVQQLLTESVLVAMAAGVLGVLLSLWGIQLFAFLAPECFPWSEEIFVDRTVLYFTLGISIVIGLLFGLIPALQASNPDVNQSLRGAEGSGDRGSSNAGRGVFVVAEVALALVLLMGAGLMTSSFFALRGVDLGFNLSNVLSMSTFLSGPKYLKILGGDMKRVTPQADVFFQETLDRLATLPGVQSVGMTSDLRNHQFQIIGQQEPAGRRPSAGLAEVGTDYFNTLQIPLLKGRYLSEEDRQETPWVVVINQVMAERFFPGADPIGQLIQLNYSDAAGVPTTEPSPRRVIGIVGNVRHQGPRNDPPPAMYVSWRQHVWEYPGGGATLHLAKNWMIRTASSPTGLVRAVKAAVAEVDPDQAVFNVMTMEQRLSQWLTGQRFNARLYTTFATLALVLAMLGIYGVMSYFVSQRTREFGIRMALGADRKDVFRLVIRQAFYLSSIGIAVGIAASFGLTRLIKSQLFGVTPTDPATAVVVCVILAFVALLACYIPARRATKVDPMVALRTE
jgi:predicted permease